MIIHGNYAGSPLAQPDWNQQDSAGAGYILGRDAAEAALAGKQNKHTTASVTLAADGWEAGVQTVALAGMTGNTTIIVASAPENYEAYARAGVYCSAQGADSLTFTCRSVPDTGLNANIMILA